jgi:hypothetical protein
MDNKRKENNLYNLYNINNKKPKLYNEVEYIKHLEIEIEEYKNIIKNLKEQIQYMSEKQIVKNKKNYEDVYNLYT